MPKSFVGRTQWVLGTPRYSYNSTLSVDKKIVICLPTGSCYPLALRRPPFAAMFMACRKESVMFFWCENASARSIFDSIARCTAIVRWCAVVNYYFEIVRSVNIVLRRQQYVGLNTTKKRDKYNTTTRGYYLSYREVLDSTSMIIHNTNHRT